MSHLGTYLGIRTTAKDDYDLNESVQNDLKLALENLHTMMTDVDVNPGFGNVRDFEDCLWSKVFRLAGATCYHAWIPGVKSVFAKTIRNRSHTQITDRISALDSIEKPSHEQV